MTWGSNPEPDPPMRWWEWIPGLFVILFIVLVAMAAVQNSGVDEGRAAAPRSSGCR